MALAASKSDHLLSRLIIPASSFLPPNHTAHRGTSTLGTSLSTAVSHVQFFSAARSPICTLNTLSPNNTIDSAFYLTNPSEAALLFEAACSPK